MLLIDWENELRSSHAATTNSSLCILKTDFEKKSPTIIFTFKDGTRHFPDSALIITFLKKNKNEIKLFRNPYFVSKKILDWQFFDILRKNVKKINRRRVHKKLIRPNYGFSANFISPPNMTRLQFLVGESPRQCFRIIKTLNFAPLKQWHKKWFGFSLFNCWTFWERCGT